MAYLAVIVSREDRFWKMFCSKCGYQFEGGTFCPRCGVGVVQPNPMQPQKRGSMVASIIISVVSLLVAIIAVLILVLVILPGRSRKDTTLQNEQMPGQQIIEEQTNSEYSSSGQTMMSNDYHVYIPDRDLSDEEFDQMMMIIYERATRHTTVSSIVFEQQVYNGQKCIAIRLEGCDEAAYDQVVAVGELRFVARYGTEDEKVVLSGADVRDAVFQQQKDDYGIVNNIVSIAFTDEGSAKFEEATTEYMREAITILVDNRVISSPVVHSPITGGTCVISGSLSIEEAQNLAMIIRGGALPCGLIRVQ